MRVYRTHWHEPDTGTVQSWHPSKRRASEALRAIKRAVVEAGNDAGDCEPSGVEAVDVPTDKDGLIGWLNVWLNTDNG
jgi:hypothetical protein